MQINWQPIALPADSHHCGHGIGICSVTSSGRTLVAFVSGFAWLHAGADTTVQYVPERLPVDSAAADACRAALDYRLRSRQFDGPMPAGYELVVNG